MTTDPERRIDEMEAMLASLSEMVGRLPSQDDAARAVRVERQVNRISSLALIPLILTFGLVFFAIGEARSASNQARSNYNGVRCILEQLAEHRVTNHSYNVAIAEKLGVTVTTMRRDISPPSIAAELVEFCDEFYPGNGPSLGN